MIANLELLYTTLFLVSDFKAEWMTESVEASFDIRISVML
jgi:hypothetical protein